MSNKLHKNPVHIGREGDERFTLDELNRLGVFEGVLSLVVGSHSFNECLLYKDDHVPCQFPWPGWGVRREPRITTRREPPDTEEPSSLFSLDRIPTEFMARAAPFLERQARKWIEPETLSVRTLCEQQNMAFPDVGDVRLYKNTAEAKRTLRAMLGKFGRLGSSLRRQRGGRQLPPWIDWDDIAAEAFMRGLAKLAGEPPKKRTGRTVGKWKAILGSGWLIQEGWAVWKDWHDRLATEKRGKGVSIFSLSALNSEDQVVFEDPHFHRKTKHGHMYPKGDPWHDWHKAADVWRLPWGWGQEKIDATPSISPKPWGRHEQWLAQAKLDKGRVFPPEVLKRLAISDF